MLAIADGVVEDVIIEAVFVIVRIVLDEIGDPFSK
jgi:hypothetical protein